MAHIILGPQGEPIIIYKGAEGKRSLDARKHKAQTDEEEKCPMCGRLFDDEEGELEEGNR